LLHTRTFWQTSTTYILQINRWWRSSWKVKEQCTSVTY
jgi:hypothetical protein